MTYLKAIEQGLRLERERRVHEFTAQESDTETMPVTTDRHKSPESVTLLTTIISSFNLKLVYSHAKLEKHLGRFAS